MLPSPAFGIVFLLVTGVDGSDTAVARVLLLAIAVSVVFAVLLAALLAADLGAPLRAIARSVDRVSAGEDPGRLELPGDDEFSRLAESHNRLARDLGRRNRELRQIVVSLEATSLLERPDAVVRRAADQARVAFGMIDCALLLVDPREIPTEEIVPGDPVPDPRRPRRLRGAARRRRGPPAGHAPLGAGGPGPVRAVRDRGRRRPSATPSSTRGSRTRTGASSSSTRPRTTSCAASRTTSRRRSRASAATRSSWRWTRRTGASGSSPSRPTGCRGWSASC